MAVNAQERWRAALGAVLGLLFTALVCRWMVGSGGVGLWLVAPMGASAVLMFALPASPLAQPWAVVGGNTVSALVGIACVRWIDDPALAGGLAVALAIVLMFALRCLHPPGGAMALIAVLSHATQFHFAWFPSFVNSGLLVVAGIVYNTATGRRYPHVQVVARPGGKVLGASAQRFNSVDLDAVLARYNQVLDISRDDLEALLQETEMESYRRRLGELRCGNIMSRQLITVEFGSSLQDAWSLMRQHRIKALPVVDRADRVVGIVTMADFMRHADVDMHDGIASQLRKLIRRTTSLYSDKPEVVGQIMTRQVRVASEDRHVVDLVPLFSEDGHHHIPIIGENNRLVGMITQSDFVRALYRAVETPA